MFLSHQWVGMISHKVYAITKILKGFKTLHYSALPK